MLTKEDIEQLQKTFCSKEDLVLAKEIAALKNDLNSLVEKIEHYTKRAEQFLQEIKNID